MTMGYVVELQGGFLAHDPGDGGEPSIAVFLSEESARQAGTQTKQGLSIWEAPLEEWEQSAKLIGATLTVVF